MKLWLKVGIRYKIKKFKVDENCWLNLLIYNVILLLFEWEGVLNLKKKIFW